MGCSLTWMARWKCQLCLWVCLSALPTSKTDKICWIRCGHHPSAQGSCETGRLLHPSYASHAWVSPVQARCIPCHSLPGGPITQLSELWHCCVTSSNYCLCKGQNIVPTYSWIFDWYEGCEKGGCSYSCVLPQCPLAEVLFVSSCRMDIWKIPISQFHLIWITSPLWHHSHPQVFWAIGWTRVLVSVLCQLQQSSLIPFFRSGWKCGCRSSSDSGEYGEAIHCGLIPNPEPGIALNKGRIWGSVLQEHCFRSFYIAPTDHTFLCNMEHSGLSFWRPLKTDSEMFCCVFNKPDTKASRMDLQKQIACHNKDISDRFIPWLMLFGHLIIKWKHQHSLLLQPHS